VITLSEVPRDGDGDHNCGHGPFNPLGPVTTTPPRSSGALAAPTSISEE
jgi:hypothetical protein